MPDVLSPVRRRGAALWVVVAALVVATGVMTSGLLGVSTVTSDSMAPSYDVGKRLVTTTVGHGDLERGDVVVFDTPQAWRAAAAERSGHGDTVESRMVKRVIGLPGDHVVCCAPGGRLVLNEEVMDEDYLAEPTDTLLNATFDVTVPAGRLWLLGDHRRLSFDSRAMFARDSEAAFVPRSAVRAVVLSGF